MYFRYQHAQMKLEEGRSCLTKLGIAGSHNAPAALSYLKSCNSRLERVCGRDGVVLEMVPPPYFLGQRGALAGVPLPPFRTIARICKRDRNAGFMPAIAQP